MRCHGSIKCIHLRFMDESAPIATTPARRPCDSSSHQLFDPILLPLPSPTIQAPNPGTPKKEISDACLHP
jgi:hypothetical protein